MFCTSFNIHNQRQYLDLIFRSLLLLNSFNIASLSLYCVFSRTLGDAPSAITYYEESAEFLSKLPTKDLEVVFSFSIAVITSELPSSDLAFTFICSWFILSRFH